MFLTQKACGFGFQCKWFHKQKVSKCTLLLFFLWHQGEARKALWSAMKANLSRVSIFMNISPWETQIFISVLVQASFCLLTVQQHNSLTQFLIKGKKGLTDSFWVKKPHCSSPSLDSCIALVSRVVSSLVLIKFLF